MISTAGVCLACCRFLCLYSNAAASVVAMQGLVVLPETELIDGPPVDMGPLLELQVW